MHNLFVLSLGLVPFSFPSLNFFLISCAWSRSKDVRSLSIKIFVLISLFFSGFIVVALCSGLLRCITKNFLFLPSSLISLHSLLGISKVFYRNEVISSAGLAGDDRSTTIFCLRILLSWFSTIFESLFSWLMTVKLVPFGESDFIDFSTASTLEIIGIMELFKFIELEPHLPVSMLVRRFLSSSCCAFTASTSVEREKYFFSWVSRWLWIEANYSLIESLIWESWD